MRHPRLVVGLFLRLSLLWHREIDALCFSNAKRASMLDKHPQHGGEVAAGAELPGMGFPAAPDGRVDQLIHPHIEDEHQHLLVISHRLRPRSCLVVA